MGILEEIANVVIEGDEKRVVAAVDKALEQNIDSTDIIQKGLMQGINIVGDKFEKMEMYSPEMLMSAEAMKAGIKQALRLLSHILREGQFNRKGLW